ncbi:MAG: membrane protein insertion efficiency factor YidD [Candidatus Planktophila sp.]
MKRFAQLLIKGYQAYSSTREPRCKYYPSCSNYAATAIRRYGIKGLAMSIWRIARCNPWSDGGIDYVDYDLDSAEAIAKVRNTMVSSTTTITEGVH